MDGFYFFFNDTATTEIYTLSLHDALPIYLEINISPVSFKGMVFRKLIDQDLEELDPFQIGNRVEGGLFEKGEILLDNIIAKGVESMDMDLIGIGTDKGQ